MISDARGGHVSPGVYTEIKDVTYSTKSLGITTLGLAGETLKGPAFQPISIASWNDFTDYFGGTSPIKYKGTSNPKYELPYIAKAYLEESKQLEVVRVLGLSGYWAGKAWVIGVGEDTGSTKMPVAILRSKKTYSGENGGAGFCVEQSEAPSDIVKSIVLKDYVGERYTADCVLSGDTDPIEAKCSATSNASGDISVYLGQFALEITYYVPCEKETGCTNTVTYNVSMNPNDPDYLYKIFP